MASQLLMPKATAVWLIDNTALTFEQIAQFCTLHVLEVQGIADGDVAGGIMGVSPINNGQLTRAEIAKAEADPKHQMQIADRKVHVAEKKRKGPRYTPISRRNDRPGAIKWLTRNHPELKDAAIMRLVGTTKTTIESIREGTHWNTANLTTVDPVTMGLCSQIDLDMEVRKASGDTTSPHAEEGTMLLTAEEAMSHADRLREAAEAVQLEGGLEPSNEPYKKPVDEFDADSVFANLKAPRSDDD